MMMLQVHISDPVYDDLFSVIVGLRMHWPWVTAN